MIVSDIYEDVRAETAYNDEALNFSRISDAIEVLNNKGDFDATLGFIDITPAGDIVTLPLDILAPLRVNISNIPSVPRDKLYEFNLAGPGNDAELVGWQWVDQLDSPVSAQPAAASTVYFAGLAADAGLQLVVEGRVADGRVLRQSLTLDAAGVSNTSANPYVEIIGVSKPISLFTIRLYATTNSQVLGVYPTRVTDPRFRRIKISKTGATAHIFFKRRSLRVNSQLDFIPIKSKMGLIFMVKALEAYRQDRIDVGQALEDRAIKFANEEQRGANSFIDISNATDIASARNQSYAASDQLIAGDVFDEAIRIFGSIPEKKAFDRITETLQLLNSKGNFDAQLGYLTLTANGNYVTLPGFVDSPIRVNINGNPAFSRNRLYEFSQNGPGNDGERVGWQWEDKGQVPVQIQPTLEERLYVQGNSTVDADKNVTVVGYDANNNGVAAVLNIGTGALSFRKFKTIISVTKDATTSRVSLTTESGEIVSGYAPSETNPSYRQIRISKAGAIVTMLVKSSNYAVNSMSDLLLVRSRMAFIVMMQASKAYMDGNVQQGQALEEQATRMALEEEKAHHAFVDQQELTESPSARNLNYNHIDTIIVADIYDDSSKIFGPIGETHLFDKISEARRILGNKAQWDSMTGYVDINTDQYSYVTLPRYVEYPVAININGQPSDMKNKWYEFHLNGPGENWFPCDSWQDIGEVVTLRDVPFSVNLAAVPDNDLDSGLQIFVQGFHRGKRVTTVGQDGTSIDGAYVTVMTTEPQEWGSEPFDRITRIVKPKTKGFIKLLASNLSATDTFTVGYYYPDELEPRYRRIKLSSGCSRIRVRYRLREGNISSLSDPIHLKSKTAMVTMMKAIKAIEDGDIQASQVFEEMATKFLVEENSINNQSQVLSIDFGHNFTVSDQYMEC